MYSTSAPPVGATCRLRLPPREETNGSEFRTVAVMACDAAAQPSEKHLLQATDEAAIDEVFASERHLLYIAATRARDRFWVSGVNSVSGFVTDLVARSYLKGA